MKPTPFFVPVFAGVVLLGAALFSLSAPRTDPVLAPFAEGRVVIEGLVARDPDVRDSVMRLTVEPHVVNGVSAAGSKRIVVSADRFLQVAYGDTVQVVGTLRTPEAFETDTGRTFNYPAYLFAHGVSYEVSFADVRVLASGDGAPVVRLLFAIKHTLIRGIERALPEPYAALAEGLLLGEKQSLGSRLYDAFVASGVVHIIVLSGYNVALVIHAVLFVSLRTLPRTVGYGLAALFVIGFAILTGGSETTIRATIMALIMMLARVLNRPAVALRSLVIAAAAMALMNPFLVLYDLSFQLSVVATLGLILFSESMARRLPFIPAQFGLREIIATTLATQVTVLPLLILSIGAVSVVFLPANALILPLVPLAMLLSFLAALLALATPLIALPFSFAAYGVLAFIISVAEFFGTVPFALITVPPSMTGVALGALALIYAAVAFSATRQKIFLK